MSRSAALGGLLALPLQPYRWTANALTPFASLPINVGQDMQNSVESPPLQSAMTISEPHGN